MYTLRDLLTENNLRNPNDVPQEMKWGWVTQLEKLICDDLYDTHQLTNEEWADAQRVNTQEHTGLDDKLLAQPPYNDVYLHYLDAQIAILNGDTEAYQISTQMYNNALLTYQNWFNRTHRAKLAVERWRF